MLTGAWEVDEQSAVAAINCNAGTDWCALVTSYARIVRRKLIGCNIAAVNGGCNRGDSLVSTGQV